MRKPAFMQLTRECNNACVFCSNPQFEKEYTEKEAMARIDELFSQGVNEISFTGGEPTLVPFLPKVISYAKGKGIVVRIISNGVKLSSYAFVRNLKESGLDGVNISVHTHDEGDALRLSGKEGHFGLALAGIRNSIASGLHTVLNSTINSVNCAYLPEFIGFYIGRFPEVSHYVFNNLDPGSADGDLPSRAGKNPWIVAKLVDLELGLKKTVDLIKGRGKTFRIERIPLCYMQGFEEFSTETRKIVKDERYICSFVGRENKIRIVLPGQFRKHFEPCSVCFLKPLCAGIQKEYADIHGGDELFPVFADPGIIRKRVLLS